MKGQFLTRLLQNTRPQVEMKPSAPVSVLPNPAWLSSRRLTENMGWLVLGNSCATAVAFYDIPRMMINVQAGDLCGQQGSYSPARVRQRPQAELGPGEAMGGRHDQKAWANRFAGSTWGTSYLFCLLLHTICWVEVLVSGAKGLWVFCSCWRLELLQALGKAP